MSPRDPVALQRAFYDQGAHEHLQPRSRDAYAAKLVRCVAEQARLGPASHVLEVGAGFGRFTFDLLEHCGAVTALDLSPRALETLAATRDERGIPEERCRPLCGDVDAVATDAAGGGYDAVVGFFILHHLPDPYGSIARLAPLLRPGGRIVFLEPNRRNLLFALQVAFCPDMSWREERGMFTLSRAAVLRAYTDAGLTTPHCQPCGFFPPQLHNHGPRVRALEERLERVRWMREWLPFLVMSAERGE